jgi:hypothetical protein
MGFDRASMGLDRGLDKALLRNRKVWNFQYQLLLVTDT